MNNNSSIISKLCNFCIMCIALLYIIIVWIKDKLFKNISVNNKVDNKLINQVTDLENKIKECI